MGIAFAIVYLPVLGILVFAARTLGRKLASDKDELPLNHWISVGIAAVGAVVTMTAVLVLASQLPTVSDAYGLERRFKQLAITLVGPFAIGISLLVLSRLDWLWRQRSKLLPRSLNRLGVGALHAVWLLPLGFILFVSACFGESSLLRAAVGRFCP